jgi:acyl dehydratase
VNAAIQSLEQLSSLVGKEVAVSDWLEISQDRINAFARATDDNQWIHVDPERARQESRYGKTIAHGFLTLSLLPALAAVVRVPHVKMAVNYGLNKVRFPSAVPVASKIRARFALHSAEKINGATRVVWQVTVERQGAAKPSCVAEWIVQYYPELGQNPS